MYVITIHNNGAQPLGNTTHHPGHSVDTNFTNVNLSVCHPVTPTSNIPLLYRPKFETSWLQWQSELNKDEV